MIRTRWIRVLPVLVLIGGDRGIGRDRRIVAGRRDLGGVW
jgi:hypothetical protein